MSKQIDYRTLPVHFDVQLQGTTLDRHINYEDAIEHFRTVQHNAVKIFQHNMATGHKHCVLERIA